MSGTSPERIRLVGGVLDIDLAGGRMASVGAVAPDSQLYYGEEEWHGGRLAVFLPRLPRTKIALAEKYR